jgi:hypothetical protein
MDPITLNLVHTTPATDMPIWLQGVVTQEQRKRMLTTLWNSQALRFLNDLKHGQGWWW